MSEQIYSWMKTLTIALILFQATLSSKDGNENIEDLLMDITLSEEELMEKLNNRHQTLFATKISTDDGFIQFMSDFIETSENMRAKFANPVSSDQLIKTITEILEKHYDSIVDGDFTAAKEEFDPLMKNYLIETILLNNSYDYETILNILVKKFEEEVNVNLLNRNKILKQQITSNIQTDIKSINNFFNTEFVNTLFYALATIIDEVSKNNNLTEEAVRNYLEKATAIYKAIIAIKYKEGQFDLMFTEIFDPIRKTLNNIRFADGANQSQKEFITEFIKTMVAQYNHQEFKTNENKYYLLWVLIEGLFQAKGHDKYKTLENSAFSTFIDRNFAKGRFEINNTKLENVETRNQFLIELSDLLNNIMVKVQNHSVEKTYDIINKYMPDDQFSMFLDIYPNYLDMPYKFTYMWTYQHTALADNEFNLNNSDSEYIDAFYNFWSRFRSTKYEEINKKKANYLADEFLEENYEQVYDKQIKDNYLLFKILLGYFSSKKVIKLESVGEKECEQLNQIMAQENSYVKVFIINYLQKTGKPTHIKINFENISNEQCIDLITNLEINPKIAAYCRTIDTDSSTEFDDDRVEEFEETIEQKDFLEQLNLDKQ